jgi:hypothetical protein
MFDAAAKLSVRLWWQRFDTDRERRLARREADGMKFRTQLGTENAMIRKLKSGTYRLYSRKVDPRTGRRRNLGTFKSRAAAEKHERAVQYFKRH